MPVNLVTSTFFTFTIFLATQILCTYAVIYFFLLRNVKTKESLCKSYYFLYFCLHKLKTNYYNECNS